MSKDVVDFTLHANDISYRGTGLQRPECIAAEPDGTLWLSHLEGGILRLDVDGTQTPLGTLPGVPNGFAIDVDGSFVIAEIETGGIYRVRRDGTTTCLLDRLNGAPLGAVNFVYRQPHTNRLWISVSTRTTPRREALEDRRTDGYLLTLDASGATVMADGLHYANEMRVDQQSRYLYVSETSVGRIRRFPLRGDATLGSPEVFGPETFYPGARVDGLAFDVQGNLWVTDMMRNGIYIVTPNGEHHCVFEDPDAKTLELPASLTFAGEDMRTVYVGSPRMTSLGVFRSPVAGVPLAHWGDG